MLQPGRQSCIQLFYLVFELDKLSDTRKILEKSQKIITFWRCCKNIILILRFRDVVEDVVKM
jgi:hypothetical protein